VSGLIIKAAHFPEGVTLDTVTPAAVQHLGIGSALGTILLGMGTIFFFSRFNLEREEHERIMSELTRRRAAKSGATQDTVSWPAAEEARA
jgi:Na+/melibiose symporter-like transporter